jgi:hypothetical protein
MAEAIHAAAKIEPEACRAAARERFALERTVERYFALYRGLAARGHASGAPVDRALAHAGASDAWSGG